MTLTIEQAERVLASSWQWTEDDDRQWAVDLWYEALALVMAERGPA